MASLHDINTRLRDLLENGYDETCIDMETGEFDAERASALVEELSLAREEKIDGIALYIEELGVNAAALKAKADALTKRAKAMESKAQRLKDYLTAVLNGEKYESTSVKISYRKTTSVVVDETVGADVYFAKDRTKYNTGAEDETASPPPAPQKDTISVAQQKEIVAKWQAKHGEIKTEEDKIAYGMLLSAFDAKLTCEIKIIDFEKVLEAIE